jgi:hypothetical protein
MTHFPQAICPSNLICTLSPTNVGYTVNVTEGRFNSSCLLKRTAGVDDVPVIKPSAQSPQGCLKAHIIITPWSKGKRKQLCSRLAFGVLIFRFSIRTKSSGNGDCNHNGKCPWKPRPARILSFVVRLISRSVYVLNF